MQALGLQAELAAYNSVLGTRWRKDYVPVAERTSGTYNYYEMIINADGSGEYNYVTEDKDGNILEVVDGQTLGMNANPGKRFDTSFVSTETFGLSFNIRWSSQDFNSSTDIHDLDGDGVFEDDSMIKVN